MSDEFEIDQIDQFNTNPKEVKYEKNINLIEFKKEIRKESIIYAIFFALVTSVIANYIYDFLTK